MGGELKPCPFCDGPEKPYIVGGEVAHWIDCYCCEASGPVAADGSTDDAVAAWNRRPIEDALRARAEAAEQRAAAAEAEVAQARADMAILGGELSETNRLLLRNRTLRSTIAADLREWAEQGGDPWMAHVADEVAAGRRPGVGQ